MPDKEVNELTVKMRPSIEGAPLESQGEQPREQKEQREQEPLSDQGEPIKKETPEPVSVRAAAAPATPSTAPIPKDPQLVDIEHLLAEDLTDVFLALPDAKKAAFKQQGEEAATKIQSMIKGGKVKIKKIFDLIREWLQTVPGVNKYFLEQEAKIKAEKILQYAKEQEKAMQHTL